MIIRPLNGSVSLRNCRLTQCQLTYLSANGYRWTLTASAWINKGSVSSGYDCRSEMQLFKIPLYSTEFCTSIRLQRGAVLRTNSLAPFPSGLCSVLFSLAACHASYCGEFPLFVTDIYWVCRTVAPVCCDPSSFGALNCKSRRLFTLVQ